MKDKNTTYPKHVIEIADYIFEHPNKNREEVLSYFVVFCRKNRRTVERYIKKAKEYNKSRLQQQEKAKDEVLLTEAKESVKKAILNREESLEILSKIAKGDARKVGTDVFVPTDSDRTRAIRQLSKMQGWEVSIQTEENNP